MDEFDLDLRAIEEQLEDDEGSAESDGDDIELGVLDGTTPADEWLDAVDGGRVLILAIDGDLNELAAGFARNVHDAGGELVHFRGFLIVTPPGVSVDTSRLN